MHGFGRIIGRRIDWILHRGLGTAHSAETVADTVDGLYPSDHYPVTATFSLSGNE